MNLTAAQIFAIAPGANPAVVNPLIAPLNKYLPQYGISTLERVSMFLAQWCEETDNFKTMFEYASGKAYEGRKDLGNVNPGDGVLFKGRGLCQLTGRKNYTIYGKLVGVDLVSNPEKAAQPAIAVQIACLFWQKNNLNYWSDKEDVTHCTYLINGGTNGLARRKNYYENALTVFDEFFPSSSTVHAIETAPIHEDASGPVAQNPTPPIWQTPEGIGIGTAVAGNLGAIFTGAATGPLAWALTAVIVVALGFGSVYLWKRLHNGQ